MAQKGPYISQNTILNFSRVDHFVQLTTFAAPVYAKRSHAPVYQISRSSRAPVTRL